MLPQLVSSVTERFPHLALLCNLSIQLFTWNTEGSNYSRISVCVLYCCLLFFPTRWQIGSKHLEVMPHHFCPLSPPPNILWFIYIFFKSFTLITTWDFSPCPLSLWHRCTHVSAWEGNLDCALKNSWNVSLFNIECLCTSSSSSLVWLAELRWSRTDCWYNRNTTTLIHTHQHTRGQQEKRVPFNHDCPCFSLEPYIYINIYMNVYFSCYILY